MYNSAPAISLVLREASERERRGAGGGRGGSYTVHKRVGRKAHLQINREKQIEKRTETESEINRQTVRTAHTETAPL